MLGALSGAFAGAALTVLASVSPLVMPGLTFGGIIGVVLWRRGLAQAERIVLLIFGEQLAWYAGFYIAVITGFDWYPDLSIRQYALVGLAGGLAWSAILTAVIALLFPFARRRWLWTGQLAAGTAACGLLLAAGGALDLSYNANMTLLWTGWHAVYAAVLATMLPRKKAAIREAAA